MRTAHEKRLCKIATFFWLIFSISPSEGATILFGNSDDLGGDAHYGQDYLLGSKIRLQEPVTVLAAGVIFRTTGYRGNIGLYSAALPGGLPDQLLAATGAFGVIAVGTVEIPFATAPNLPAGDYWFMAVYSAQATSGGGIDFESQGIAYRSLEFTPTLPLRFGPAQTYTGQQFNYFLVTQPIPEPSAVVLAFCGLFSFSLRGRSRPRPM